MSDDTQTTDDVEEPEPEPTTEQPEEESDERPELDADDRADIDLSGLAEDVEESVNPESAEESDDGTEESAEGGETTEDTGEGEESNSDGESGVEAGDGETWGDMYVEVLAVVLIEVADEYSDDDGEMDRTAEDVATLAQQPPVNLQAQVNRLAQDMNGAEDLPPGQAVAISTGLLAFTVLMQETDVAGDVVAEVTA